MDNFNSQVNPAEDAMKFDRTDAGMEAWMIFCVMVAGKGADQTRKQLERFLKGIYANEPELEATPFERLAILVKRGVLPTTLEHYKLGQYTRLTKAFTQLSQKNAEWLRTASVDELETIHGVGHKTARFYIISTREGARYAALDTHLLKYLRTEPAAQFLQAVGYTGEVPKATPVGKKYMQLEKAILLAADASGKTPYQFDFDIWKSYYKGQ
jgi:thermostable 8-oxoguanine DNA glycosylase